MPVSSPAKIYPVMSIFNTVKDVTSVLDIGCGFGKYGVILREFLDVKKRRYSKQSWKTTIDAIDIWSDYISPLHGYIYNKVLTGNIVALVNHIESYDVILFVEVLEHLEKRVGTKLLPKLYEKCNKALVLSFPPSIRNSDGANWENPHELHKSLWTFEDLKSIFPETTALGRSVFHVIKDHSKIEHTGAKA